WVLAGNNTRVENIEFSEAAVPDQNGAGIRLDGIGVSIKNCYFHHNENGILTANNGGTIRIENSEFGFNGFGDGFSHNVYIGRVDSAIIRFSYFHHANVGHEYKSRARVNYIICNRFSNEALGNASREIDLPNGGVSVLISNIIQQSPNSENGNMVGYGLEGLVNAGPHLLYLVQNSFVNDRSAGSFIAATDNTSLLKIYNNIFAGPGSVLLFGGTAVPDMASNISSAVTANFNFINAAGYDYHIGSASPALNAGTNAGTALNGESLQAVFEYQHPAASTPRTNNGATDAGAYESAAVVPLYFKSFNGNYANGLVNLIWKTENETGISHFEILKAAQPGNFQKIGTMQAGGGNASQYELTDRSFTTNSRYQVKAVHINGAVTYSKIIAVNITANDQQPFAILTRRNIQLFQIPKEMQEGKTLVKLFNSSGALLFKEERELETTSTIENTMTIFHSRGLHYILLQMGNRKIMLPALME
ncbi:MAG: hypothetical protein WAT19_12610, partial [Ferruginibacter sp.]